MRSNCDHTDPRRATITSAGTIRSRPAERWRRARRIEFECLDASAAASFTPTARSPTSPTLDFAKVNPVTGPIFIDGAEPGDALKVTIDEFKPSGFGWTANIPGFGLLADQFKEPALTHLELRHRRRWRRRCSARTARCR